MPLQGLFLLLIKLEPVRLSLLKWCCKKFATVNELILVRRKHKQPVTSQVQTVFGFCNKVCLVGKQKSPRRVNDQERKPLLLTADEKGGVMSYLGSCWNLPRSPKYLLLDPVVGCRTKIVCFVCCVRRSVQNGVRTALRTEASLSARLSFLCRLDHSGFWSWKNWCSLLKGSLCISVETRLWHVQWVGRAQFRSEAIVLLWFVGGKVLDF